MRNTSWIVVGLAAIALAVGCTTKSEEDTGPASGGSSGGGYTPTPNGVGIGEQEACEMLRDAFDKHASRLSCTYTLPECPAYIRAGQAPVCSKYDEGTVKGCADFYAGFTSCSEFQKRPCHIMNIEGSAPTGCPDDAGVSDSEEPTEAGEPDAEEQVDGGEPDAEEQVDGGEPDAEEQVDGGEPDAEE